MSFWPFPKTILDALRAAVARGPGLDVGAADGALRDRLRRVDIDLYTVDRVGTPDVCADALALPVRTGVAGLVLAANLLRHLPGEARGRFLAESARVLAPGGVLALVEDHPEGRTPAERNYRAVLDALARWSSDRGPVLDLGDVVAERPPELHEVLVDVTAENEVEVADPMLPVRWLQAHAPDGDAEFAALAESIESGGMRYGEFRVCALRRAGRTGASAA